MKFGFSISVILLGDLFVMPTFSYLSTTVALRYEVEFFRFFHRLRSSFHIHLFEQL